MGANFSKETLDLMKGALASPMPDDLIKTFTQPGSATTGYQDYNLEKPAQHLIPILTPLRNSIIRVNGGYATQANWKAFTNINAQNQRAGVSEGKRGGVITHTLVERLAAFRGFGLENSASFESVYAAQGFGDPRTESTTQTLWATMIQEERLILGGNTSVSMGTTPTPTLVASTTGGALATAAAFSVICVALGLQAYLDVAGVNNGSIGQYFDPTTALVPAQITRTNADGTTDTFGGGSAQQSANATVSVTGATGSVAATVAPVTGAVGYAWYCGATAGTEKLAQVTTINSCVITALPASGNQTAASLGAQDSSTSTLDFDGLLYQAWKSGSNAYIASQATGTAGVGTPLTSDGSGGIAEFEQAFAYFYNRYRLSPDEMHVSSQEMLNMTKKIVGNGGAPLLKLNVDAKDVGTIQAGVRVGSYMNKITNSMVEIIVHPNMPAGTIFFRTRRLPYPLSGVATIERMLMRRDYYAQEWPVTTRKYTNGVYADGVLQHYAPFSMGILTNIGNG